MLEIFCWNRFSLVCGLLFAQTRCWYERKSSQGEEEQGPLIGYLFLLSLCWVKRKWQMLAGCSWGLAKCWQGCFPLWSLVPCPWEVHCFVADKNEGEPICFLFSSYFPFFYATVSLTCLSSLLTTFTSYHTIFFFTNLSPRFRRVRNTHKISPSLLFVSGMETWKPFSSITSWQINQSDLWQTPNRTANFSKLSRSSVWFIFPEMEGMFSSHAPHSSCLWSIS